MNVAAQPKTSPWPAPIGTHSFATIDAWLFDGVIAVYEKNMRLELE